MAFETPSNDTSHFTVLLCKSNVLKQRPFAEMFLCSLMVYGAQNLMIMISVLITLTFLMHCLDLGGIPLAGQESVEIKYLDCSSSNQLNEPSLTI